ncbi:uncharacterized protein CC84DRAFT_1138243 [Paraphaeosphaeria sporulosa]|uniref:DNA polymerase delta subunit 3 n=1 Tax=Paraphaeosphaeria sporulosa TaxID=1460663 RepID=A0A177CRB6_9PLEO|nr:uncharacterized protein CC84DRAFT_1138243 [Paraphaeosphaeria sporulosa]OAG10063.1 hypothetical protein CC84DRAFT_1138243 [Paraphaeosphaeria sporulosa]
MAEARYREYLVDRVLAEGQPITYRLLSRALQVHVNIAKQMLYDFHAEQTKKQPKSVHATYLLTGKERSSEHSNGDIAHNGDDTAMRSSPFMSSLPEPENTPESPVPTTSVVLVREEELEKTKSGFEEITSIHIYSLEPGPIENLNLLAVCNQEIARSHASGDPLERWRDYGSIQNPYIKRRTTKYAPAMAKPTTKATVKATAAVSAPNEGSKQGPAVAARKESTPEESKSGRSTPQPGPTASLKRSDSKTMTKKDASVGNLFKSFAKAKPKAKEAEKPIEEDAMQGMSEDEGDADDEPAVKFDEEKAAAARKAREEREQKLQEMMEADGTSVLDMPDAPTEETDSQDAPIDKETPNQPAESEATVTVQGGRRRGKRRVMKKKKVKDEDGYLVTKEEAVWESFSEDEPEPKKAKPTPKPTVAKGKKNGGKGQGSIASFFKKA